MKVVLSKSKKDDYLKKNEKIKREINGCTEGCEVYQYKKIYKKKKIVTYIPTKFEGAVTKCIYKYHFLIDL